MSIHVDPRKKIIYMPPMPNIEHCRQYQVAVISTQHPPHKIQSWHPLVAPRPTHSPAREPHGVPDPDSRGCVLGFNVVKVKHVSVIQYSTVRGGQTPTGRINYPAFFGALERNLLYSFKSPSVRGSTKQLYGSVKDHEVERFTGLTVPG
jgi:hypothetical protein